MKLDQFLYKNNEKYERYLISNMPLGYIYKLLINENYSCFFIVFKQDNIQTRVKLPKINCEMDFIKIIEGRNLSIIELGLDSEEVNILEGIFIDCYKYPK